MTAVRIQVLTIESDSSDPQVWRSIRRLLRRTMQGAVVTTAAVAPAPKPAPRVTQPTEPSPAPKTAAPIAVREREPERVEPAQPVAPKPAASTPWRRTEAEIKTAIESTRSDAAASPMLADRVLAGVEGAPGVTVANLTVALFGKADADLRRRVDMVVSNLHMAGKLMRTNGQLYPAGYRGPTAVPAPKPAVRGEGRSDEETKARARERIIARFTEDNAYSIHKLAIECFGDNTGASTRRVRHMLYQLGAHKVLENTGVDQWRPVATAPAEPDESDEDSEG